LINCICVLASIFVEHIVILLELPAISLVENCFSQQTNEGRHRRRRWLPARHRGIYRTYTSTFPNPALDPAVEGKSYNCAQSRYLMYAGATDSSVDAVTPFDVAAERQIPRLRATRGNRYQVIVQISPKYRGAGGCDAFGCGLAWTLTFGLGEALANGSVEGGSCHTINCGLAFGFGLAFTGGAVGEHEAFVGLGSALGISVAYRHRDSNPTMPGSHSSLPSN
jgi:hypothetical protein